MAKSLASDHHVVRHVRFNHLISVAGKPLRVFPDHFLLRAITPQGGPETYLSCMHLEGFAGSGQAQLRAACDGTPLRKVGPESHFSVSKVGNLTAACSKQKRTIKVEDRHSQSVPHKAAITGLRLNDNSLAAAMAAAVSSVVKRGSLECQTHVVHNQSSFASSQPVNNGTRSRSPEEARQSETNGEAGEQAAPE
jgi:hypothetical protein